MWRLAGEREGGSEGRRSEGRIFAYHQSRERECNEERICVGCMCVLGMVLMG